MNCPKCGSDRYVPGWAEADGWCPACEDTLKVNNYKNLVYYAMKSLDNLARTSMRARAALIYLRTKVQEIQTITGSGCTHCLDGEACLIHQPPNIQKVREGAFYNGALGEPWPVGRLLAETKFEKPVDLKNGDELRVTYTVQRAKDEFHIPQDFFVDAEEVSVDMEGPEPVALIDGEIKPLAAMYGYVMSSEPEITCKCLGCQVEATAPRTNLTSAGWSDIESDTTPGSNNFVGICMRDACRQRFGLPTIQSM